MIKKASSLLMGALFGAVILTASHSAISAEDIEHKHQVVIDVGSKHFGSNYDFNESNPGIGYQYDTIGVNIFENSFKDTAAFFYYDSSFFEQGRFKVGAYTGVLTGYDDYPVTVAFTPYIQYSIVNLALLPAFVSNGDADAVVALSLKVEM